MKNYTFFMHRRVVRRMYNFKMISLCTRDANNFNSILISQKIALIAFHSNTPVNLFDVEREYFSLLIQNEANHHIQKFNFFFMPIKMQHVLILI